MELNPGVVYWMEMTFFTLIRCKNCIVCLKRPKMNETEARVGPFLENVMQQPLPNYLAKQETFQVLQTNIINGT